MPAIRIKHVRSFSSEDRKFPAENLVSVEGIKKWKSATNGEKQVSCVLQFDEASQIHSIDIGNEGAAFIEVLVGRMTDDVSAKEPDFQVLLVASSFMNPLESKTNANANRVRMFDKDKLNKSLANEKWDLVKIVCTQPFNKNTQYGVSFIKFHSPPKKDGGDDQPKPAVVSPLGLFRMKERKSDDIRVGSAFSAYKRDSDSHMSASASARSSSKFADEILARETASLRTAAKDEVKTPKRKHEDAEGEGSRKRARDTPSPKNTPIRREVPRDRNTPETRRRVATPTDSKRSGTPTSDRRRTTTPTSSDRHKPTASAERGRRVETPKTRPFKKLMSDVVFAMSGYQNPERGDIRDRACAMGATYKPDWGKGCTHLICAFVNTPKYNTVRGKGRIVSSDWIDKSYKKKEKLPWRKFRLGRAKTPPGSSDDEHYVAEETVRKASPQISSTKKELKMDDDEIASEKKVKRDSRVEEKNGSRVSDDESRLCRPSTSRAPPDPEMTDDSDATIYDRDTDELNTDDEIEKIRLMEKNGDTKITPTKKSPSKNLPDFFKGLTFLFYGDMTPGERRVLTRLIVAYDGALVEYMGDDVTHIVTNSKWDEQFDRALGENSVMKFVRPNWVFECDKLQKKVCYDTFCVESD